MIGHNTARIYYWDYLRAFMIILVVLEHALLPYSPLFKNTAFIADFEGNCIFDIWHLHNDAIMMPLLFLIAGFFIMPSYQRRGLKSFTVEKFWRWMVPFVVGVMVLVPLLTYPRDLIKIDENLSYYDYLTNFYYFDKIQAGGFWFLYYLALITSIFLIINKLFPHFTTLLTRICNYKLSNPFMGFFSFVVLSAVILGISDLLYGPWWWQGFGKVFYVRGSRYIIKIVFFLMGVGLSQIPQSYFSERLSQAWAYALMLAVLSFSAYSYYCINYFYDGAYNFELLRFLKTGGSIFDSKDILVQYAPPVLIRTTLLALTLCSLTLFYISTFVKFLNRPINLWQSLAICSFGIYIFHEPIQVGMTYLFYDQSYSEFVKFPVVFIVSLVGSWGLTYWLRNQPGFKKVL